MDLTYSSKAEAYRDEVRAFLAEHLPEGWRGLGALDDAAAEAFLRDWRPLLHARGLLAAHWPREAGGAGLSAEEQAVLVEEFGRVGAPLLTAPTDAFGIDLLGNTLLHWGTEEQKRHFLPRILSGEDRWCQGYSEPDAGSDLASLRTRARLEDGEWVLDGQKIWVTAAHEADWVFVLARTDRNAQAHRGLSLLLVPLEQPGVEVRPIELLTGEPEFNEIFFTGARTPADHVVGEVGNGWTVALTLLGFERGAMASHAAVSARVELDRLIALARERGVAEDPAIRRRIAWCHGKVEIQRHLAMRAVTSAMAGGPPGAESSINKLYESEYHQAVTELALAVLGMEAVAPSGRRPRHSLVAEPLGAPNASAAWTTAWLGARPATIYGGSSQIQRNIIGELVLGLPREPRAERTRKAAA